MKLSVLSHACLLVSNGSTSVVIDPWLLGSCYWRSWWNFPAADFDPAEFEKVSHVVLSHLHWDHWHGPTLKRYFRGKQFIIADEPNGRSEKDLRSLRFADISRVRHGQRVDIAPGFTIYLYQFGLFLNDCAIVVEVDGQKILNANDAKIAGAPLDYILKKHGPFDFAFRSHSSANPRICYQLNDGRRHDSDDPIHYARSFKYFMDAVRPKFAIPFASNHCHLHRDVFHFNAYVTNPLRLRDQLGALGGLKDSQLVVMLPGSQYSDTDGFTLRSEDAFVDLDHSLASYRDANAETLARQYAMENKVVIGAFELDRLNAHLQLLPALIRLKLRRRGLPDFRIVDSARRAVAWLRQDGDTLRYRLADDTGTAAATVEIPALVLKDSILKLMYHHAAISKRVLFQGDHERDLRRIAYFWLQLERLELGVFPLRASYLTALFTTYRARWRELGVYAWAATRKFLLREPLYLVEEKILSASARKK